MIFKIETEDRLMFKRRTTVIDVEHGEQQAVEAIKRQYPHDIVLKIEQIYPPVDKTGEFDG